MAISAKELQKEFKRDLDADQAKRLAKLLNKAAQGCRIEGRRSPRGTSDAHPWCP